MSKSINFQFVGIAKDLFVSVFAMTDSELAEIGARPVKADSKPGFPCRISLEEAEVGEALILLSHVHQPGKSPYLSSGPVYVRKNAQQASVDVNTIPGVVETRLISVRAYDANHMMIDADVCEGKVVAGQIQRMFENEQVAYLHVHNAARGCYSCRVDRAA